MDTMRKPLVVRILSSLDTGPGSPGRLPGPGPGRRAGAAPGAARESPFHVSTYAITLLGKIMCYALVAVAMDLIWGYGGILSLGHGLFFALGGYAFGMYLMRQIGPTAPSCPTSWSSSTGRSCRGSGSAATASAGRPSW
jgi:urea transport system permease protein